MIFSCFIRHEQGPNGEIVPRYSDRLVLDKILRGRLGPGGKIIIQCLLIHETLYCCLTRYIKS